jgi:hypothetical protein
VPTWGNALQPGKVNRLLLAELARRAPLLPGKDALAFIDIDSMQGRVYGHKKQGAAFGHTKIQGKSLLVRGLNALAATISTPLGAPVIAGTLARLHQCPPLPVPWPEAARDALVTLLGTGQACTASELAAGAVTCGLAG